MDSSVDDMTNQKRKSNLTSSPIAARTRSMQKRLSSSQNVQTSPVEKSPKKKLKGRRKTKSTDELSTSDIESCMKTLNCSNNSEDSVNPRSSKLSETSVIATRMPKSKNSKDSKIKVNTEATMVTRKSAQQGSKLLDIQEKCSKKSRRSKTGEANADVTQTPKAKSVQDLEDIEAQKMTRKSSRSDNEQSNEEMELAERSSSVKHVEAKVTSKSPELLDANDEVHSSENLLKKDSRGQKLAKELSPNQEPSTVISGLKAKRKSKQLPDHMLDILEKEEKESLSGKEELDLKLGRVKSELVNELPKKEDNEIKGDKTMLESSSKKTKKKYAAQNSTVKFPIKSVSANINSEEESEKNTTDHIVEHAKEKSSKKMFSPIKNKLINCDRQKVNSGVDLVIDLFQDCKDKYVHNLSSPTVNQCVRSDLSPKVREDCSELTEDESISSDTSESTDIQFLQSEVMLYNYSNNLGDINDISELDIKSITKQKKTYKDSFSGIQEKVNQFVPNDDKVVIKPTKDEGKELNSKFPINAKAYTDKICAPSVTSNKYKSFVVESFGSSINKTSPKSQPSKQVITHPESDSDAESRKAIMESAQRRIEQNLSTSESDCRYLVKTAHKSFRKPTVEAGSSDSGSAPENISFESGRKTAMESLKNAVESIQREKQRRKAKRKERLEKLKQQKEEKLIRLKEKLASQEDASCSSSEESGYEEVAYEAKRGKKKRVPKTRALRTEKENVEGSSVMVLKKTAFSDMDSDDSSTKVAGQQVPVSGGLKRLPSDVLDNLPDQIPMKYPKISQEDGNKKKRKKEKGDLRDSLEKDFKKPANLDYIPLETGGPTKFGVVPLEKAMKAPKAVSQQAADFRQNLLYGSHIKREPAKATAIYQQKMKASGNDIHVR